MDEIAALECAYTHTRQALCGVEGLKQTVSDELFIHSCPVILNFHDGKAGVGSIAGQSLPLSRWLLLGHFVSSVQILFASRSLSHVNIDVLSTTVSSGMGARSLQASTAFSSNSISLNSCCCARSVSLRICVINLLIRSTVLLTVSTISSINSGFSYAFLHSQRSGTVAREYF